MASHSTASPSCSSLSSSRDTGESSSFQSSAGSQVPLFSQEQERDAHKRFSRLLQNLSDELNEEDKRKAVSFRYKENLGPWRESMSMLTMMEELRKIGVYSPKNPEPLEELVKYCDRHDLVGKITEYRQWLNTNSADQEAEDGPGPTKKMKLSNTNGEFTVSEITMECDNASVHGGEPTDGQATVKFACTNPLELRSIPATTSFKSIKVLGVRGGGTLYTRRVVLDKLEGLKNYLVGTLLTVSGKIVSVDDPLVVGNSVRLKLKECKLADSTMTVTLNVWEDEIDKVIKDSCYQFINVRKKEYEGQCFLSTTKNSDTEINEIGDIMIGEVSNVELPSTPREVSGEIFAVVKVDKCKKCPIKECSSRVYRSGKCNKCKREIALSQCVEEIRVHLIIKDETTKTTTYCEMAAFKRELDQMVQNGIRYTATKSKIVDMLLKTKPMTFVIDHKNNVIEVRDIVVTSSKEETFPTPAHDHDFCTIL